MGDYVSLYREKNTKLFTLKILIKDILEHSLNYIKNIEKFVNMFIYSSSVTESS